MAGRLTRRWSLRRNVSARRPLMSMSTDVKGTEMLRTLLRAAASLTALFALTSGAATAQAQAHATGGGARVVRDCERHERHTAQPTSAPQVLGG